MWFRRKKRGLKTMADKQFVLDMILMDHKERELLMAPSWNVIVTILREQGLKLQKLDTEVKSLREKTTT